MKLPITTWVDRSRPDRTYTIVGHVGIDKMRELTAEYLATDPNGDMNLSLRDTTLELLKETNGYAIRMHLELPTTVMEMIASKQAGV